MYKKVLVPLDGSELAECALEHVNNLFQKGAIGEVTIFTVVRVDFHWNDAYNKYLDLNAMREALFDKARKYLSGVESRLVSLGMKVKTAVLEGQRPADAVLEYAQKNEMDMIAIATHGYTGLKKLMFGSVAYGVLHDSHVPVLLIRPDSCRA
jgi:nucleotide-binding universal stress UspA family protein